MTICPFEWEDGDADFPRHHTCKLVFPHPGQDHECSALRCHAAKHNSGEVVLKKKKKSHLGKGNYFEWEIARSLSLWLTEGVDKTQLVRSVQSGGNIVLRNAAFNQVGDIAPNGPAGDIFRSHFGVECKNHGNDPDWWHSITNKNWVVQIYWDKIVEECKPFGLSPLLIFRRDCRPTVVILELGLATLVCEPDITLPIRKLAVVQFKRFLEFDTQTWFAARSTFRGVDVQTNPSI
jgi:hypothetical protein